MDKSKQTETNNSANQPDRYWDLDFIGKYPQYVRNNILREDD